MYHPRKFLSYTHNPGEEINRLNGNGISLAPHSLYPLFFNGLQKW
jgi:hypothetical protein